MSLLKWLPWRYDVAEVEEQMPDPSDTLGEMGEFPLRKKKINPRKESEPRLKFKGTFSK